MDLKRFGFFETDRLQGSANYFRWSFTVENIFKGLKLWDIITGSSSLTTTFKAAADQGELEEEPVVVTSEGETSNDEELSKKKKQLVEESLTKTVAEAREAAKIVAIAEKYEERKQMCLHIFSATVSPSILPVVKSMRNDPSGLWKRLRSKFESAALQRKLDLRNELMNIRMEEDTSIEEFIKVIDHFIMQLADVDEDIPDKELIHVVLRALPSKWKPFKMTFGLLMASNPNLSFSDLEQWLSAEEQNQKNSGMQAAEESMVM